MAATSFVATACAVHSTSASSRRHLASNVICMWPDDRPTVEQAPRRGRFPKAVAQFYKVPRLRVGAVVEMINDIPENNGLLLVLLGQNEVGAWEFESLSGEVSFANGTQGLRGYCSPFVLRRSALFSMQVPHA